MARRFSLHKIESKEACPFNEAHYSRFKFGDTFYAKAFAKDLSQKFIDEYGSLLLEQPEIILLPSPCHAIPTASNFLCSYFKKALNEFLYNNGKKACIESKIYRTQTYVQDYGNMDFEQRINLISNDSYYIDKGFIEGKFCLFLDDIKITGSHEKTVNKILEEFNVSGSFVFIYYAELINTQVHPNIENYYNYFAVKTVEDIIQVLNSENFCFNTRIVKYVLLMNLADFDFLLESISIYQKEELFDLAISNDYHQIKEYQNNIVKLKNKLWQLTCKKGKEKTLMLQNS